MTENVAANAPQKPARCHPTSVAALRAMGPGVDCAIAMSELNASGLIQRGTISCLMRPTTDQPPPKATIPTFKKVNATLRISIRAFQDRVR